jgi:hypothetical protein
VPFFLRTIRKAKWYKNEDVSWLAEGELQADALADLATKGNELSVWHIEDDRSNLEQVVTAVAAGRDNIANLDYALFDQQILSAINIKIKETKGGSPDEKVNAWHRDLVELSATKLMELAKAIQTEAAKERILPKDIIRLIKRAIASGQIERAKLKPGVTAKIENDRP